MVQRTRGRGEIIPQSDEVLGAMGDCRKALIRSQSAVKPFGPSWHAIAMVTAAIDTLALFMTGQADHFSLTGSISAPRGPMP